MSLVVAVLASISQEGRDVKSESLIYPLRTIRFPYIRNTFTSPQRY